MPSLLGDSVTQLQVFSIHSIFFFLVVSPKPETINKAKKARMRLLWLLSKCA